MSNEQMMMNGALRKIIELNNLMLNKNKRRRFIESKICLTLSKSKSI